MLTNASGFFKTTSEGPFSHMVHLHVKEPFSDIKKMVELVKCPAHFRHNCKPASKQKGDINFPKTNLTITFKGNEVNLTGVVVGRKLTD